MEQRRPPCEVQAPSGRRRYLEVRSRNASFDLTAECDYYPRWYRARVVMLKLISRQFAADHAGLRAARKPATG